MRGAYRVQIATGQEQLKAKTALLVLQPSALFRVGAFPVVVCELLSGSW